MIQPTLRAFAIFAVGVPLALFLVIYDPGLWLWSFDYGALVLIVVATTPSWVFRQGSSRCRRCCPTACRSERPGASR